MSNVSKIIAIIGTTSSGKTNLAVKLSQRFNGEIISADSRQVYKYMDIGTGKDLKEYEILINRNGKKQSIRIPYYCIDIAEPKDQCDLVKWLKCAKLSVKTILAKRKLPIVAGGTGLYAQALIEGYDLSRVAVDNKQRQELVALDTKQLLQRLRTLNKKFVENLNGSELNNKQRLVRYIEIASAGVELKASPSKKNPGFDCLVLGIKTEPATLKLKIEKRLKDRLEKYGLIEEVESLHNLHQVSWARLSSFGLEYKYITLYLRNELNYDEMFVNLNTAIGQFAKRQMTWYRRWEKQGRKIYWVNTEDEANKLVVEFTQYY